jgi:hypothetical protein
VTTKHELPAGFDWEPDALAVRGTVMDAVQNELKVVRDHVLTALKWRAVEKNPSIRASRPEIWISMNAGDTWEQLKGEGELREGVETHWFGEFSWWEQEKFIKEVINPDVRITKNQLEDVGEIVCDGVPRSVEVFVEAQRISSRTYPLAPVVVLFAVALETGMETALRKESNTFEKFLEVEGSPNNHHLFYHWLPFFGLIPEDFRDDMVTEVQSLFELRNAFVHGDRSFSDHSQFGDAKVESAAASNYKPFLQTVRMVLYHLHYQTRGWNWARAVTRKDAPSLCDRSKLDA